jgi:hypothetical protein
MADDASENEEHDGISPESNSVDQPKSDPSQGQKGEENNKCSILINSTYVKTLHM